MLKFPTHSILLVSSLLALSPYQTFYQTKIQDLSLMKKEKRVFLGDSLTMRHNWSAFKASNLGIDGDTTQGVLKRISQATQAQNIVLMIGVNDILQNAQVTKIQNNYIKILDSFNKDQTIYVLSLLPVLHQKQTISINQKIKEMNKWLQTETTKRHIIYINLYPSFLDKEKKGLSHVYTTDGIHLTTKGYKLWEKTLKNILSVY